MTEHDVELGQSERRSHLVLGDLDTYPVAYVLGAVLDGLDTTDVEPHGGVELQGTPTWGYLR